MSVSWLKRSGIQRGDGVANDEWHDTVSSVPPEPEVEVRNDKATPVISEERGIPSVNRSGFRSRALPFSLAALALAVIGVVWLVPSPKPVIAPAKDDPRATKNERFDENRPTAVLTPSTPPLPPAAPAGPMAALKPDAPAPLAIPNAPIKIVPAPDPRATPAPVAPKTATAAPPTPLELRQQSKALIIGAEDKAAPTTIGAAPTASANGLGPARLQPAALRMGVGGGGGESDGTSSIATMTAPTAVSDSGASTGGSAGATAAPPGRDALGDALRPTLVSGTSASKLADRTFMMTQGNLLDCSLDVAISSAVPGMTKCTLTRSVYGDDRKVVLLERGTELTGQYQGGMQQGQKRLFILWVRAKTPSGVVITLSSPGTDSLGRSGVDGFVDTHFWERFGAGLLLSVIDDVFQIGLAKVQNGSGGNTTIVLPQNTAQTTKSAAAIAVESDVHIPPTLDKNQGEHVSIFVARDLDFRTVYALRPVVAGQ
jgi:type IV secretion system protein VirB10